MISKAAVKQAIQGLERHIVQENKKQKKILAHMKHFLFELSSNIQSLSTALECFISLLPDLLRALGQSSTDKEDVLQHIFSTLLRLHDGMILITSGECRHPADIQKAQSTKYPSQLTATTHRSDGYTTMYKRVSVYSGTGWDEWFDRDNGLQTRLERSTGRKWAVLTKGSSIGTLLDCLEFEIRGLEDSFKQIKSRVETDLILPLQQRLHCANVKVKLDFACKLESMKVSAPAAKYSGEWKRMGKQFQLQDSVLPHFTSDEWIKLLSYHPPAVKVQVVKKRKRRVILESDEEDESSSNSNHDAGSTANNNPRSNIDLSAPINNTATTSTSTKTTTTTSTGLVVQHKKEPMMPDDTEQQCSLNEIKTAMGVDVGALETSHQAVFEEEAETWKEAQMIDEEDFETQYKTLRKQLQRAESKSDDDATWEIRECLRETAVAAGNQNLWTKTEDATERRSSLEKALYFFKKAQELVEDQEALHRRMASGDTASESSLLFQRNLKLLRGRACTNAGITLVELCRIKRKKSWVHQAIEQFDMADYCLEALQKLAPDDAGHSIDVTLDKHKAQELELLTCRWRGMLLWIKGDRQQAMRLLQEVASATVSAADESDMEECMEAKLKILTEAYQAGVTLADLAMNALEESTVTTIRQSMIKCEELWCHFSSAMESATTKSRILHDAIEKHESGLLSYEDFLEENAILSGDDLQKTLLETRQWWERKKALSLQTIAPADRECGSSRNDLSAENPFSNDDQAAAPPRRFVIHGSSPFPHKPRRRRRELGAGYSNIGPSVNRPPQAARPEPRKYRPWGDELLPQVIDENGRKVPKLSYPSIAPEMPPDIKARFEAMRLETLTRSS